MPPSFFTSRLSFRRRRVRTPTVGRFVSGAVLVWALVPAVAAASEAPDSLLAAVRSGDGARVAELVVHGTPVDARDPDYYNATSLMLAVEREDLDTAKVLLRLGADVNGRDKSGDTALNWAAYYGYLGLAKVLLAAGADPALTGHGNALEIARRRGHEDLLLLLADSLGEIRPVPQAEQVVLAAVAAADTDELSRLLAAGKPAVARDSLGRSALHLAAEAGADTIATALLAAGARVDTPDPIGFTPLMNAARGGHTTTARLLVEAGADVNHRALVQGLALTPLPLAASAGDTALISFLLRSGAEMNAVDETGNSACMWALAEGRMDAVLHLLARGADPDLVNRDGDSLRSVALKWGIAPLVGALGLDH